MSHEVCTWPGCDLFSCTKSSFMNSLRPRHNGRHFADDTFKCIFLNENVWIPITISLKFVPMGPINNIPTLVQIMAWRRPGDKPLSETMMVRLLTHICVTRPQRVNKSMGCIYYNLPVSLCIYHDFLTHWHLGGVVVILKVSFLIKGIYLKHFLRNCSHVNGKTSHWW